MKKTRARFLSILLTVCMVLSLMPTVAFAAEDGTTIGASSLCEHHEHTADCYTDTLTCDIVVDSGELAATEGDAAHEHGEECYESILDCKFVCEECVTSQSNRQIRSSDITITQHPADATYTRGDTATPLTVVATAPEGETLSYQWMSATSTGVDTQWTPISEATNPTYTPPTAVVGTMYYLCEASFAGIGTMSNPACIQVLAPDVTTAAELKAALEDTTPVTFHVTQSIALSEDITVGGNHTLDIAQNKTVSTNGYQLTIPTGKQLNLTGNGTLRSNNTTSGQLIGISIDGNLYMNADSKLDVSNQGNNTVGVSVGTGSTAGHLSSQGGTITIANSGTNSAGISGGSGTDNDMFNLSGGSLTVENTGGYGISGVRMSAFGGCQVTVASSGSAVAGLSVIDMDIQESQIIVRNTAGDGIVTTTGGTIIISDASSLVIENTGESYGMRIASGKKLEIRSGCIVSIADGGRLFVDSAGTLTGTGTGKLTLTQGAKLDHASGRFSDRGTTCAAVDMVTVAAETAQPSADGLTAGDYVWNSTLFAKTDVPSGTDIEINATNFPDEKFRAWLTDTNNIGGAGTDGTLTPVEIATITTISVSNKSIASLQGIEHFTALTTLSCTGNRLTTLDVSKLTQLSRLVCENNQLISLGTLPNSLTGLQCQQNRLTGLDVTGLNLMNLNCSNNYMASTDAVVGFNKAWNNPFIFAPQHASDFKAVTDIVDLPTQMTVGTPLTLTGTVVPADATNQTIVWSVSSGNSYGAVINDGVLSATKAGEIGITAIITNGAAANKDYSKTHYITINDGGSSTTYTISGTVSDGSGVLADATVQLLNHQNTPVGSAVTTDSSGTYNIPDVIAGEYTIEVSKEGYTTGTIATFTVSNTDVTSKDIALEAINTAGYILKLGDTVLDVTSTTQISGTGYSYQYDATNNVGTLTLNGYTNSTIGTTTASDGHVIQSALFANLPLTIVLAEGSESQLFSGDTTSDYSVALYMDGAPLTIKGNGTLRTFGGKATRVSAGIHGNEPITIEGGTIVATNDSDYHLGAISAGKMFVTGGSVTANGVNGIVCSDDLTVSGSGSVTSSATVGNGIYAGATLTVSDSGSVTGTAGSSGNLSAGIHAGTIILNDNAAVTGTGGAVSGGRSYGIYASKGNITVNGGRLTGIGGAATGTGGDSYGLFLGGIGAAPAINGAGEIIGIAGAATDISAGLSAKSVSAGTVLYVSPNRDGSELIKLPSGTEMSNYPYAVNYIPVVTAHAFYRDGVKLEGTADSIKIPAEFSSTIRYQYKDIDQFGMEMDTAVTWEQGGTLPSGVTVGTADTSGFPVTVEAGASTGSVGLIAKKQGAGTLLATLTVNIVDKVDVSSDISFENGSGTYTGSGLTHETAVFNGTESGTGSFTYTYAVPIGSTGDLDTNGKPLDAGAYNVTAVYEDDTQRGEATATFTVNKATPVITGVSAVNTTVYPTSYVVLNHTDSHVGRLTLDDGQALTVGTKDYNWTFTPTDAENYNNATGTISITVVEDNIVSLTVTTPPSKTTYRHGETLDKTGLVLTATLTSGSTVRVGHNDMSVTYQNGNAFVAGDTSVTLGYGGLTATQAVTVNKVDYTGIKAVSTTVLSAGQSATLTLPNLPDGAYYVSASDGGGAITMTDIALGVESSGAEFLVYTAPASTAGQTGTITITVTGATYYNDYTVTVTVTSTDKTPQDISYAVGAVSKTYGEIYTNELTKTTVNGDITYASDDTAVATVNRSTGEVTLKGAGTATITATAQETATHAEAAASYTITVAKRAILVKPRDFTIKSNENMPTFDWSIFGIAVNDNLVPTNPDAIAMQAQENGVPLTTVKVGTFDIVFTTAPTFAEAVNNNYNITIGTGTLTVTQYNSGGGGSGGGGSTGGGSNTTVTTPPSTTENPNPPTEVIVAVKPAVSGDTVSADVSEKTVDNAITKAQAEAKKHGTSENGIMVEIKVDTKNTKAENITTGLPKESVDALVKAGAKELRITSEIADISLNLDTLKEIQKQVGADVKVTAKKVDNNTLSSEAKKIVGNRPVYDFAITGTNGKKVTDFGSGSVSVSIPYTLGANENAANVVAYYIDSNGNITEMPNSVYDPVTKTLSFVTDHFSRFAVGYKAINVKFTDITNHWAKDSIEFVAARGLLKGTGDNKFSPNTSMTRGMFVTALGRLAEIDPAKYTKSSFTDVKADAYYMPYVEWASKNGIVNGIGDGKFAPEQSITREQMAVIMANYAKAIGFELSKVHAENIFADSAKISSYAKDAVKAMQMAGVLAGKNGNKFDPQGTATRAEVSAVLKCVL